MLGVMTLPFLAIVGIFIAVHLVHSSGNKNCTVMNSCIYYYT